MRKFTRPILWAALLLSLASQAVAAPAVFWASDPVQPGQTVVVIGEGFGEKPKVEISRLLMDLFHRIHRPTKAS